MLYADLSLQTMTLHLNPLHTALALVLNSHPKIISSLVYFYFYLFFFFSAKTLFLRFVPELELLNHSSTLQHSFRTIFRLPCNLYVSSFRIPRDLPHALPILLHEHSKFPVTCHMPFRYSYTTFFCRIHAHTSDGIPEVWVRRCVTQGTRDEWAAGHSSAVCVFASLRACL